MFQDKNLRTFRVLLAVGLLVCMAGPSAQAITFFRASADFYDPGATYEDVFVDVVNEPDSGIWWNQATITYKLDAAFKTFWPDQINQDLVREAFTLWGGAIGRDYGTVDSHLTGTGTGAAFDMLTLALHELGHGVGFGHPFQGAAADPMLNFHFAGWDTGIPYDGTQTWIPEIDTDLEVMGYGAGFGDFNRQLSWDELNGARYHYLYGGGGVNGLNFVEVTDGSPTDITVTAAALGWAGGGTLAYMEPEWDLMPSGDPVDGGVIHTATMVLNSDAAAVIGFQKSSWACGWELSLFLDAYGITVDVSGGSGVTVLSQTSGTMGGNKLERYETQDFGDFSAHVWTHPENNHPVVGPTIVGVEYDVQTGGPLIAYTTDEDGNLQWILPATTAFEFQHTGLPDDDIGPWRKIDGYHAMLPIVLEEGITLRGTEDAPSLLTRIWLADVSRMGLDLGDLSYINPNELEDSLNDELIDMLEGIDLCMPCLGDIVLGEDGEDVTLVFTDGSNLSAEMLADPNTYVLDRPDLLGYREMLVVLESEMLVGGQMLKHRSFSLLGQTVTGIPEPASLALLFTSGLWLMAYRRRRSHD